MIDPDTLREIQRLMNESRDAMCDPLLNKRRIAALLGIPAPEPRNRPVGADLRAARATPTIRL